MGPARQRARGAAGPALPNGTGMTMQRGTHYINSCVEKSQTESESLPESACKPQESLLVNDTSVCVRELQGYSRFLVDTRVAYPNSPVGSGKGMNTCTDKSHCHCCLH